MVDSNRASSVERSLRNLHNFEKQAEHWKTPFGGFTIRGQLTANFYQNSNSIIGCNDAGRRGEAFACKLRKAKKEAILKVRREGLSSKTKSNGFRSVDWKQ